MNNISYVLQNKKFRHVLYFIRRGRVMRETDTVRTVYSQT